MVFPGGGTPKYYDPYYGEPQDLHRSLLRVLGKGHARRSKILRSGGSKGGMKLGGLKDPCCSFYCIMVCFHFLYPTYLHPTFSSPDEVLKLTNPALPSSGAACDCPMVQGFQATKSLEATKKGGYGRTNPQKRKLEDRDKMET